MTDYELTVILKGNATPARIKSVSDKIEKIAKALDGKLAKKDEWGKLDLAYDIKKEKQGNFVHYTLSLEASAAKSLNQKLKMEDDMLRYLLVRKNG